MSRNVDKLSMILVTFGHGDYNFPHFFYLNSSIKELKIVRLKHGDMIPTCKVSWKSLRNLSLSSCNLTDESIANILSGCPKLQSLSLHYCDLLERLDLSKSMSLTRLEIVRDYLVPGPTEIVAPHIHCLILTNSQKQCILVDVSSLTQTDLDICIHSSHPLNVNFLQIMVLEMLTKLKNVERFTIGAAVIQILSLAELCGVPLPTFKIQTLIVKMRIVRSGIPGIARLLQNSPGLKKLIVHTTNDSPIQDGDFNSYLDSQGVNPYQCWRSEYNVFPALPEIYLMKHHHNAMLNLLDLFIELPLRNTKTIETLVVLVDNAKWFEELLQMVQTLSHNSNVSIELKRSNY